jgi:hypothetical protein
MNVEITIKFSLPAEKVDRLMKVIRSNETFVLTGDNLESAYAGGIQTAGSQSDYIRDDDPATAMNASISPREAIR